MSNQHDVRNLALHRDRAILAAPAHPCRDVQVYVMSDEREGVQTGACHNHTNHDLE